MGKKADAKLAAIPGKPENGDRVRDRVTGFEGMVVARTEWLNGCIRVQVAAEKIKDSGKPVEIVFDEQQIEVLERDPHKLSGRQPKPAASARGGDRDDASRRPDSMRRD